MGDDDDPGYTGDPSEYSRAFTDTSAGTGWDPRSGGTAGVGEKDAGVESVQNADYSDLAAEGQRWERQHYVRCNFSDANLARLTTVNCSFIECNFTHADLSRSQHQRSAFVACTFAAAQLTSATIEECKLSGSVFDGAAMNGVTFPGGGDLTSTSFEQLVLTGVDLTNVVLYGANLTGADFTNATLVRADRRDTTIDNANFSDADLQGAFIGGFDARRANLDGARVDLDQAGELAKVFGVVIG
jgi:uncharacterized protein YjbI with pentapeptide repeats